MGWEMGNWKQSDDVPCAKEDLHAANRCSSRQYCRADLIAVRRIQSSGAGLVFGEFGRVFARRLVFPAIAWRQLHFQPARSSRRACAYVRQSSSISLPHLPSNSSSRTTRILTATLVLCLYHSLGLYIAYSISSPPSLLLIASGPQSTISQSIAPPRCDATTQQRAATLQGSGYGSELHLRSGQLQVLATTIRFFRYTTPSSRLKYSYNASQHKRDHHP
jgi:hypothetical protein